MIFIKYSDFKYFVIKTILYEFLILLEKKNLVMEDFISQNIIEYSNLG